MAPPGGAGVAPEPLAAPGALPHGLARLRLPLQDRRHSMDGSPSDSCGGDDGEEPSVPLSPLSQFFCNVAQPPDIYAIMQLAGHCRLAELFAPMQLMADLHDRFRRRLVLRMGTWVGEVLESFDVRSLMREVTLPGPDAQAAFDAYMGQLMSHEPLGSNGLPPWDVICIHYACTQARTDVLMRASHIIGDGQLFMKLIKQIMAPLDAEAEADYAATLLSGTDGLSQPRSAPGSARSCSSSSSRRSSELRRSSGLARGEAAAGSFSGSEGESEASGSSCSGSSGGGSGGASVTAEVVAGPAAAAAAAAAAAQPAPAGASQQQRSPRRQRRRRFQGPWVWLNAFVAVWRALCMAWHFWTALVFTAWQPLWASDPVTLVKASPEQCSGARHWSSLTLGLPAFHTTAKLLATSINTLAVSCVAGGVRRYLLRAGAAPATRLRMCSMVDTRSMPGLLTGTKGNSNNFSFIGVPLYTGECSVTARLRRVAWSLSWIRHSLAVPLAIRMPGIIQFLLRDPAWSSWAILRALPSKTSVGFSNMRGPAGRWSLSGHPVVRIHNGVQPNAFGCFISLFSYSDTLTFTHTCYASKTDSPEVLLACVAEEFDALRKAAALASAGCGSEPGLLLAAAAAGAPALADLKIKAA